MATKYKQPIFILADKGHATKYLPYTMDTGNNEEMMLFHIHGSHTQVGKLVVDGAVAPIDALWQCYANATQRNFWLPRLRTRFESWKFYKAVEDG
jgi:hypothetical protein